MPLLHSTLHSSSSQFFFFFTSIPYPKKQTPFLLSVSSSSSTNSNPNHDNRTKISKKSKPKLNPSTTTAAEKLSADNNEIFPSTIPKKPRRGRRSEAAAVEDLVRSSLDRTFASIREQNPEFFSNKPNILKQAKTRKQESKSNLKVVEEGEEVVVDEEDQDWPVDAEVGWGVRASEYFDRHPIRNVMAEDGSVIDWEGEIDDGWVKEINCLEWESFAFHPSPLIVLVFQRYNRAADNWKLLKELEKAAKVYWSAKDRLPPRTVKIDINIETDLAYALKVKECPQLLFLRGNRILYREKETRSADELVQMIAHFYYNARRPSWIDTSAVTSAF